MMEEAPYSGGHEQNLTGGLKCKLVQGADKLHMQLFYDVQFQMVVWWKLKQVPKISCHKD